MIHVERQTAVKRSGRVIQLEGMFDLASIDKSVVSWDVDLPLAEREWGIGLIVGPSGSGKTTIARELFGTLSNEIDSREWPTDAAIVDGFRSEMSMKDITALLSSVGFSSPPSWLRPYHVLSNGEQFRVNIARALSEHGPGETFVVDEFTSVVDRTVAQIGSAAVAKAVRARGSRMVAVTCHYDVVPWLDPDWIYEPATNVFQWRELRGRPRIELEVCRTDTSTWRIFSRYHYLDHSLHRAAACFVGLVDGRPVAFASVIPFPHAYRSGWRGHRMVCLPDFQGVGIGNALFEFVASLYRAKRKPFFFVTSLQGVIRHCARSPVWRMTRSPSRVPAAGKNSLTRKRGVPFGAAGRLDKSRDRLTAGFEYVGPPREEEARLLGVIE